MVHPEVLTATAVVFTLTFLTSGFLLLLVLCLELPLLFWKRLQPFPIFLSQGIMVERPSGWICRQRIWSESSEWFGKNKGTNEERKLKCNEWKRGHKIPRNAWQLKICIHLTSASHGREVLPFFFFYWCQPFADSQKIAKLFVISCRRGNCDLLRCDTAEAMAFFSFFYIFPCASELRPLHTLGCDVLGP